MKPISVIGMGLSPKDLTQTHLDIIAQADILVGGKRLLEFFETHAAEKKVITKNLADIVEYIKQNMTQHTIVVLASGDPLFYGIGSFLVNTLGRDNVEIYPNITSLSGAFSRIKEPWQDAHIVSLHGRDHEMQFLDALKTGEKVVVFTDSRKNPGWIARFALNRGFYDFKMCVFAQLGAPTEEVKWYSLSEASENTFKEPNIILLKRTSSSEISDKRVSLGAPDDEYDHKDGLITKAEVRAITISKLRLLSHHTVWDLGAGSGSISIEASLFVKRGRIFAVEKNTDRIKHIESNKQRFNVKNIDILQADAPEGLENLPRPDRVFIGGGGNNLRHIIEATSECLNSAGIIVINTVLLQNSEIARETLRQLGYEIDFVQIQVNRSRKMPWGDRLDAQNPVWIISGKKAVT